LGCENQTWAHWARVVSRTTTHWIVVRLEREGETAIRPAVEDVTGLGAGDYLETPEASSAIAAGEVVAAARDGEVSRLPEAVQDWLLAGHGDGLVTPALLALALSTRGAELCRSAFDIRDMFLCGVDRRLATLVETPDVIGAQRGAPHGEAHASATSGDKAINFRKRPRNKSRSSSRRSEEPLKLS
jgi:hypothetical protein